MSSQPFVKAFFDEATFTVSYVVSDETTKSCVIIDSVLDYDHASGHTSTKSADDVIHYVQSEALSVEWILETHVHADHLSAAPYLKKALGGKIVIGDNITTVQNTFGKLLNVEPQFACDGSQFDHLVHEGDELTFGQQRVEVLHTPGHTPACVTYVIGDAAFVGDTLFMPDYGTARCDFPGGDAATLYRSIQKIFALPEPTRLFMCHDYKAPGREEYIWETTVAEQKANNVHIHQGITEEAFCKMRTSKDATLAMPRLIWPSVQVNMRAGDLPPAEENGTRYLKTPINLV
ncbi:MBL fold metallo-hydrolase [Marinomonas fungiae]|uniref:Glyoxylase or a related metal-dependent hydrolase, beta-lactamase superfamily II n=1 Tax=Marinomonas fungiae TaxID=1137284 RepID=A0A0K6IMP8_9GAMM|nr:MBL fold metallo-hydrolase [Marinomonas fungiae]CUB04371.1 Glyoxylase or a related metal-dependent hydrolase, beta-lactamase superfamily II [Marinomonas fungiae]